MAVGVAVWLGCLLLGVNSRSECPGSTRCGRWPACRWRHRSTFKSQWLAGAATYTCSSGMSLVLFSRHAERDSRAKDRRPLCCDIFTQNPRFVSLPRWHLLRNLQAFNLALGQHLEGSRPLVCVCVWPVAPRRKQPAGGGRSSGIHCLTVVSMARWMAPAPNDAYERLISMRPQPRHQPFQSRDCCGA